MHLKTIVATTVLVVLPAISFAQCFGDSHEQATMSCTDGTTWDPQTRTCIPTTS